MKNFSELVKIMMMKYIIGKSYLKEILCFCYWYSTIVALQRKEKQEKNNTTVGLERRLSDKEH